MPNPDFTGTIAATNLAEVLRLLIRTKQTGQLVLQDGEEDAGVVEMENGMILSARAGADSGMRALFEIVAWHGARFEFHQQPLPRETTRDLAVYDPEVLIAGVAAKVAAAPVPTIG